MQLDQIGTVSTTVSNDGIHTIVTYHSTQVVKFNEKEIILNTGGWRSATTKVRMNQTSNQFGLGYQVWQERGEWYVKWEDGLTQTMLDETIRYERNNHGRN
jgi:hypothetical protein